jgi:hypothetical protein
MVGDNADQKKFETCNTEYTAIGGLFRVLTCLIKA